MLVHLVDGSEGDAEELKTRIAVLNRELERFSTLLSGKPQLIVLNKVDARPELGDIASALAADLGQEVLVISGVSGQGLPELENRLLHLVSPSGSRA
jgi:GTP-binding protein